MRMRIEKSKRKKTQINKERGGGGRDTTSGEKTHAIKCLHCFIKSEPKRKSN